MKQGAARILITAGPTWAALDAVRVIGNRASGETGLLLARELERRGAAVTVLLGQASGAPVVCARVTIKRFTFFHELARMLEREISTGSYDCVVHSAAVCDFLPRRALPTKMASLKKRVLELVPAPKLIDRIKDWDPSVYAVGFKYEPECTSRALMAQARSLMRRSCVDAVVANTARTRSYRAYIVERGVASGIGPYRTKSALVNALIRHLARACPGLS